ncbi:MAG: menaquinone biosynthetic enzyme MqnA/MqnD family protein [Longimicrobiales bacterium]
MIRLGHIEYSNCFPVHARFLAQGPPAGVRIRSGVPSELNRALAAGEVDVAPCSSIEYARHADRYRILPGLTIAARGAVRSIVLESAVPLDALDGRTVALPTVSASSVLLLRLLLERRHGVRPVYTWFSQGDDARPLDEGAAAALFIGDVALRRVARAAAVFDLGRLWTEWTGLPFVFALWQTTLGPARDRELATLQSELCASLAWFAANLDRLAEERAPGYGLGAPALAQYWSGIQYDLDEAAIAGLERFYRGAAELGDIAVAPGLRWAPGGQR